MTQSHSDEKKGELHTRLVQVVQNLKKQQQSYRGRSDKRAEMYANILHKFAGGLQAIEKMYKDGHSQLETASSALLNEIGKELEKLPTGRFSLTITEKEKDLRVTDSTTEDSEALRLVKLCKQPASRSEDKVVLKEDKKEEKTYEKAYESLQLKKLGLERSLNEMTLLQEQLSKKIKTATDSEEFSKHDRNILVLQNKGCKLKIDSLKSEIGIIEREIASVTKDKMSKMTAEKAYQNIVEDLVKKRSKYVKDFSAKHGKEGEQGRLLQKITACDEVIALMRKGVTAESYAALFQKQQKTFDTRVFETRTLQMKSIFSRKDPDKRNDLMKLIDRINDEILSPKRKSTSEQPRRKHS